MGYQTTRWTNEPNFNRWRLQFNQNQVVGGGSWIGTTITVSNQGQVYLEKVLLATTLNLDHGKQLGIYCSDGTPEGIATALDNWWKEELTSCEYKVNKAADNLRQARQEQNEARINLYAMYTLKANQASAPTSTLGTTPHPT
jgi:hypothetical protein